MLRRVLGAGQCERPFLSGERVDARVHANINRQVVTENKRPAEGRPQLMGIPRRRWPPTAVVPSSFRETTRVLTGSAVESKSDYQLG